ncbi:hypothetical protein Mgra_00007631 [Meloidogyne graminicola]|uniref:Uncharacterized protein n=1 Tax=Meloidogyne graminicola TaxID=189291 RepID=A0A8S9ZI56_9BILA|nr:hypothetical protein Mgra_00007631 [Meloidogyne graminicola]
MSTIAKRTIQPFGHVKENIIKNLFDPKTRLLDYYKMQEIVNWLPTIKEKIDFVNPYERDWKKSEKTWHRRWMRPLVRPRKAWAFPVTPNYFDPLNFYKYVAKCKIIDGVDALDELENNYFKSLVLPTKGFEKRVTESLKIFLEQEKISKEENHPEEEVTDNRAKFFRSLIEDAHLILAKGNLGKLIDHRISFNPRCESFWIRAGFTHLYDRMPIWETDYDAWIEEAKPKPPVRFTGDDERRLGELSFTLRDNFAVQVRSKKPMKNIFEFSDDRLNAPLFPETMQNEESNLCLQHDVIFNPRVFNLQPDLEILWQCPGYDYDCEETHTYGRLAIKDISSINNSLNYWDCEKGLEWTETLKDCIKATAIISLFNWLNGQAHCLGNTQYTDLNKPITSQLILSDGKQFWFAVGQLNTIAINIDVEGFINNRINYCYLDVYFVMKIETEEQLLAAIGEDTSSFVKQGKMDGVKRWCWNGILNSASSSLTTLGLGSTSGVVLAAREILFRDIGSQMSKKKLYVFGTGMPIAGLLIGASTGFLLGICVEFVFPRFFSPITTLKNTGFDRQKISEAWKKREEQYKSEAEAIFGKEKRKIICYLKIYNSIFQQKS